MSSYLLTQKHDNFQPFQDGELVITKIIIIAYSRLSVNKRERIVQGAIGVRVKKRERFGTGPKVLQAFT